MKHYYRTTGIALEPKPLRANTRGRAAPHSLQPAAASLRRRKIGEAEAEREIIRTIPAQAREELGNSRPRGAAHVRRREKK